MAAVVVAAGVVAAGVVAAVVVAGLVPGVAVPAVVVAAVVVAAAVVAAFLFGGCFNSDHRHGLLLIWFVRSKSFRRMTGGILWAGIMMSRGAEGRTRTWEVRRNL